MKPDWKSTLSSAPLTLTLDSRHPDKESNERQIQVNREICQHTGYFRIKFPGNRKEFLILQCKPFMAEDKGYVTMMTWHSPSVVTEAEIPASKEQAIRNY